MPLGQINVLLVFIIIRSYKYYRYFKYLSLLVLRTFLSKISIFTGIGKITDVKLITLHKIKNIGTPIKLKKWIYFLDQYLSFYEKKNLVLPLTFNEKYWKTGFWSWGYVYFSIINISRTPLQRWSLPKTEFFWKKLHPSLPQWEKSRRNSIIPRTKSETSFDYM